MRDKLLIDLRYVIRIRYRPGRRFDKAKNVIESVKSANVSIKRAMNTHAFLLFRGDKDQECCKGRDTEGGLQNNTTRWYLWMPQNSDTAGRG
ncbi:hypothetical protein RJT34_25059 [Clitoria ternatea]|uniref:Uncharacterized protein n=1 Tax=Clitoria ternatea TaxID=43366 RepID=A0AAN9II55_CLITE